MPVNEGKELCFGKEIVLYSQMNFSDCWSAVSGTHRSEESRHTHTHSNTHTCSTLGHRPLIILGSQGSDDALALQILHIKITQVIALLLQKCFMVRIQLTTVKLQAALFLDI